MGQSSLGDGSLSLPQAASWVPTAQGFWCSRYNGPQQAASSVSPTWYRALWIFSSYSPKLVHFTLGHIVLHGADGSFFALWLQAKVGIPEGCWRRGWKGGDWGAETWSPSSPAGRITTLRFCWLSVALSVSGFPLLTPSSLGPVSMPHQNITLSMWLLIHVHTLMFLWFRH